MLSFRVGVFLGPVLDLHAWNAENHFKKIKSGIECKGHALWEFGFESWESDCSDPA